MPEVLGKFQGIVGVGRLNGPSIRDGKQPLYRWEATSRGDVARVADLIGPWLCPVKRAAFETVLANAIPSQIWPGSTSEELAWAGGFFDGEGSTYLLKHRTHAAHFTAAIEVPQACDSGVAVPLLRFRDAVGPQGRIYGPRRSRHDARPYHRWRAEAVQSVELSVHRLFPFIGAVKRAQAVRALETVHSQESLPRGNPQFGSAGARYCLRGHDKWTARVRPYASRGRGVEPDDGRQCRQCVRDYARRKRRVRAVNKQITTC
jgi:hypothetical protein